MLIRTAKRIAMPTALWGICYLPDEKERERVLLLSAGRVVLEKSLYFIESESVESPKTVLS